MTSFTPDPFSNSEILIDSQLTGSVPGSKSHMNETDSAPATVQYPYTNLTTVFQQTFVAMAASFNDIRCACQSAQNRIMRLQQATNNQVGLTSSVREGWFEELRHVAQCFITAQQASAKIEQSVNTERAQLQGALSAALNERDVRQSERDAAGQEIKFLRAKINELLSKMKSLGQVSDLQDQFASFAIDNSKSPETFEANIEQREKCESWVMTGASPNFSPNDDSTEETVPDRDTMDLLHRLPSTVEDMPLTPERGNNTANLRVIGYGSFNSLDGNAPDNRQLPKRTPPAPGDSQSRFFGKNSSSVVPRNREYSSNAGARTPDYGSRNRGSRFGPTPAPAMDSQGPFAAPPVQQYSQPVASELRGRRPNGHTDYPPPSSSNRLAQRQQRFPPSSGQPHHRYQRSPQPPRPPSVRPPSVRPPSAPATMRPQPPSKELTLVRDNGASFPGVFAPGVVPQNGSPDEGRVVDIFQFFNAVKVWVDKYCSTTNIEAMHNLANQHPRLWDYACSVTYPGNRQNASSHSLFMLCNRSYRSFFISRLVIQYVVQQMWTPQAWEGLDDTLTETLVSVKQRLDLKYGFDAVLQPHERYALVEKRSRAIYDFMRQPTWSTFKEEKINQATARFKDIVGPMLEMERINQGAALDELMMLCESALRLSAILNTSRLSFQFIFNECGIKFSDGSHRPLNSQISPRELQVHHWRLMSVVTPGITYRNDAGVGVDPRFLAKANVLLMQ